MYDKNITINLFRISSDSKYLDIMIECPAEYHFSFLEIEARLLGNNGKFYSQWFDLSTVLQFNENLDKTEWNIRIPLSKLGIFSPGIYKTSVKATLNDYSLENYPEEIQDTMICSDVNGVYYHILDYILNTENRCFEVSDDAIRNYLILYGHQQALIQLDLETAELYFKIMINNFNKCGGDNRPLDRSYNKSCNCK